jgi:Ca2+-binding RTX toxin-like protein
MGDCAVGGDDTFIGGANSGTADNLVYGDALTMSDKAQGGNDTLTGGNFLVPLPAGTYNNTLIGDAQTMSGNACGGNDKLISGAGNDDMWGDAQVILGNARGGNDTFVFNFNNGHDKIEDFGQGVAGSNCGTDHIDVSALGIQDFSELSISAFDPTTHESTITFSSGNDVVVHSQVALTERDFLFA